MDDDGVELLDCPAFGTAAVFQVRNEGRSGGEGGGGGAVGGTM